MIAKVLTFVALLLTSVGVWAQDTDEATVTKSANNNEWTLTVPAYDVELQVEYKGDLTLTLSLEDWAFGATASAPAVSGNEGNGTVTYEYKAKDAADDTYTETAPTNAGNYTIRATVAEIDDYADATATADFTILKAAANISYETDDVSKAYGDADFTNVLTHVGDGLVTYASDNESVASVDYATGLVHIVGAGEATITATVIDGENYTYATKTAQYALSVTHVTGIDTVISADDYAEGQFYDLNGRRISGKPDTRGMFILNGRKVVIK